MAWSRRVSLAAAAVAVVSICSGCVNMSNPARLAPGASAEEIRQLLGEPSGRYPLPGGGQRLEYARGPFGKQTWMLDVDGQGRLSAATQVLTERQFNAIKVGASAEEVLRTIGRPANTGCDNCSAAGHVAASVITGLRYFTAHAMTLPRPAVSKITTCGNTARIVFRSE